MSFFIENWILIAVAFSAGAMLMFPALTAGGGADSLNPAQAVQLMNREKAAVIDVCGADEFASGHVVGAKNIPLGQLGEGKGLPSNKAIPLVVVCAAGSRSARAVAQLKKLGYENAQSLSGGLKAWREANLPTEKA